MGKNVLKIVLLAFGAIIALSALAVYGVPYLNTPEHIRKPTLEHLHFRTQVVVDGQAVNFGEDKFQENKPNVCTEDIPETPIHFHDGLDQMTHIHWVGITGGEVLKYYGWNLIGGSDDSLGSRFDEGAWPVNVPIHGQVLPALPAGANFYVYVGDENGYQRKDWSNFLKLDLPTFLGKASNFGQQASINWFEGLFFKPVSAHGGESHNASGKSEEELQRINNLVGDVVIFVQPNEPSSDQIKERFNNLVPLTDSTCGG